jgi:hypothetical protein
MEKDMATDCAQEIMTDFAMRTGLAPVSVHPRRYLWTDAFAVCNYLSFFQSTGDKTWRDLGLRLIDQVHHTLGQHREDDSRTGWISSLDKTAGELHPTAGGLRIGKEEDERRAHEGYDERGEWDRDGQYYHYLTKWMHALSRASCVTSDPRYAQWAVELAQIAHAAFTYIPVPGGRKRMFWKMSIDLSHPLVPSMGQHDPLDGLVTYNELQATAARIRGQPVLPVLDIEIADMAAICRGVNWTTDDPLGIGGLLSDAFMIARLIDEEGLPYAALLGSVVDAVRVGLDAFARSGTLGLSATDRLAFRELGLAIGLVATKNLSQWISESSPTYGKDLGRQVETLARYLPVGEAILQFWMNERHQKVTTWTGHREINMVMLATSLAPDGFLAL